MSIFPSYPGLSYYRLQAMTTVRDLAPLPIVCFPCYGFLISPFTQDIQHSGGLAKHTQGWRASKTCSMTGIWNLA